MAKRRVTVKKRKRAPYSKRRRFWFDEQAAHEAVDFIQSFCSHVKGEFAGERIQLTPHDRFEIEELFGWKRNDHTDPAHCTRQYRQLWDKRPRKNAKSTLAAAIALYVLFCDGEPGAEVYSAAGDREQAGIVFDIAKTMRDQCDHMRQNSQVFGGHGGHKRSIIFGNSFYRVLSADAFTKHGLNAHCIVVDEVHVQRNRDLVDTLRTSVGSRRQPLEIYITTAGYDRNSICYELHDYAEKVIAGVIKDDSFLPFIYAADEKDDWTDPKVWAKANPNLGITVKKEYLEQECRRAQNTPGYQNTFRRLHLNQWTEQDVKWLDLARWDKCKPACKAPEARKVWAGLDLASTTDIAALALLVEPDEDGIWDLYGRFWVPEENLHARVKRDRVPYDVWRRDGLLRATEGNVIDYDVIRQDINDLGESFNIVEIAADRWNATQIITQLEGDGFVMVPFGQGFASMGAPTKEFEVLVNKGIVRHGGNPIYRWMASNVAVKMDPAGFLKPDKSKSSEKIDGIVAAIMALGRATVYMDKQGPSIYETRGIVVV